MDQGVRIGPMAHDANALIIMIFGYQKIARIISTLAVPSTGSELPDDWFMDD